MGCGCNVGAGTVFGNYDGREKHECEVGDNVFIGAHMLVRDPVPANWAIAPEGEIMRPIGWSRKTKNGWKLIQPLPSKKPQKKKRKPSD